ncbi:MAG: response regulator [Spirochaetes bacterium]|nr:response regulator [Spirochaetota bacterium]
MKKVLIIDENEEFRDYLQKKIIEFGCQADVALNGLDGSLKMRKIIPDLIVMDHALTRKNLAEVLEEKEQNPNTISTPIVLLANKIDKSKVTQLAKYGVKKIYSRPLKIDSLLKGISEILGITFKIDETQCIIEANFNDEIIFIEIARGLNIEKIEILKFKLEELVNNYDISTPKILLMISGIVIENKDLYKMRALLDILIKTSKENLDRIVVLTNEKTIRDFMSSVTGYKEIEVKNNLSDALDYLIGQKADNFAQDKIVEENLLTPKAMEVKETKIEMRFETEDLTRQLEASGNNIKIAVVDDDFVIRKLIGVTFKALDWQIDMYENGKQFVDVLTLEKKEYNLVFLDISMPELDGFGVLEFIKQKKIKIPVIVFSTHSQKETVLEAVKYGVKSYMSKPLNPNLIKRKTVEILNPGF